MHVTVNPVNLFDWVADEEYRRKFVLTLMKLGLKSVNEEGSVPVSLLSVSGENYLVTLDQALLPLLQSGL